MRLVAKQFITRSIGSVNNRNMSEKHLSAGSVEPPRIKGLLRVYSMKICPFAKRARLVVNAKNLPHDVVNIDLQNKPDWYFEIHPKGQVPALLDGDKITTESLDIADYLDEKYPENPLYPADPVAKKNDQEVIRTILGQAIAPLGKIQFTTESYTVESALELLLPGAQLLEDELERRAGPFFGGEKPGMIDYMLWPWAERAAILPQLLGVVKFPLRDDQISKLRKWIKAMIEVPIIKELYTPPDILIKDVLARKNNTLNYATLFNE